MSHTTRKIRKGGFRSPVKIEEGGDAQARHHNDAWVSPKKMKPYAVKPGFRKMKAAKSSMVTGFQKGITKTEKLAIKNANRSVKKAVRQQTRKGIDRELDNL